MDVTESQMNHYTSENMCDCESPRYNIMRRVHEPTMNIDKNILQNYISSAQKMSQYTRNNPKKFANMLLQQNMVRQYKSRPNTPLKSKKMTASTAFIMEKIENAMETDRKKYGLPINDSSAAQPATVLPLSSVTSAPNGRMNTDKTSPKHLSPSNEQHETKPRRSWMQFRIGQQSPSKIKNNTALSDRSAGKDIISAGDRNIERAQKNINEVPERDVHCNLLNKMKSLHIRGVENIEVRPDQNILAKKTASLLKDRDSVRKQLFKESDGGESIKPTVETSNECTADEVNQTVDIVKQAKTNEEVQGTARETMQMTTEKESGSPTMEDELNILKGDDIIESDHVESMDSQKDSLVNIIDSIIKENSQNIEDDDKIVEVLYPNPEKNQQTIEKNTSVIGSDVYMSDFEPELMVSTGRSSFNETKGVMSNSETSENKELVDSIKEVTLTQNEIAFQDIEKDLNNSLERTETAIVQDKSQEDLVLNLTGSESSHSAKSIKYQNNDTETNDGGIVMPDDKGVEKSEKNSINEEDIEGENSVKDVQNDTALSEELLVPSSFEMSDQSAVSAPQVSDDNDNFWD